MNKPAQSQPFALSKNLAGNSCRKVGNTDYVTHLVESMPEARQIADQICEQSMLPVYFDTGCAVNVPHIVRMDYGNELVLRFYPQGEDRSGNATDYTCVHTFTVPAYSTDRA